MEADLMPARHWFSLALLASVLWVTLPAQATADENEAVRPARFAGSWYPGKPETLARQLDEWFEGAKPPELSAKPVAVIAPHAGYRYCADVAAAAYAGLRGHTYQRVVVLAFSHRRAGTYRGVDVPRELTAYATPLGAVPIDRAACDRLLENPLFSSNLEIGRDEHSLELQLPFLQRALKDFKLVPLLLGQMSDSECAQAARALLPLIDADTLLVASSDFTHFGRRFGYQPPTDNVPAKIGELAAQAAIPIGACDYDGFVAHLAATQDTICGRGPIRLLLRTLSMQGGARGVRAAWDTSGGMTGDWSSSVTYQSFVFTRRPGTLSKPERAELLRIARQTVTAFLNRGEPPRVDAGKLPAALRAEGGCFVTLENHGQLRGCIGNMTASGPLYEAVVRNAVSACQDRRFVANPVTADELDDLHIEISYLTPMRRVEGKDEIIVGRHGLLVSLMTQRGVLLPQVAYERGWTREEFLAQTCRKAGLPPDAWKRALAQVYSFEAEVFGEPER
jgi:AmmeMemoRadiSam system protein B/AmmeMemoRadiSam system protein A